MGAASVVRFTITGVRDSVRGGGVQIVPQREERERERDCAVALAEEGRKSPLLGCGI